jgi:hypothetical protein
MGETQDSYATQATCEAQASSETQVIGETQASCAEHKDTQPWGEHAAVHWASSVCQCRPP